MNTAVLELPVLAQRFRQQGIGNAAALSVAKQYVMPGLPTRETLEANFRQLNPEVIE